MANSTASSASLVQTANVAAANSSSSSSSASAGLAVRPVNAENWKMVTLFAGFLGLTTVLTAAL